MESGSQSPKRLALRAVLKDVSPIVARLVSVPDCYEIRQLHEVFMATLDWRCDPDFIIRGFSPTIPQPLQPVLREDIQTTAHRADHFP